MYEGFYGFKAEPFRLSPDHHFCYSHSSYAKAKAYMQYAFQRAEGFVMITGRPGTGKTTLVNDLVATLSSARVKVAMLVCTQLEADDLLRMVAYSFGLNVDDNNKAQTLQRLGKLLVSSYKEGRRPLLIIDEAQILSRSAMEELRLLTNLQLNGRPLLQIFLLGQEELKQLIHSPSLEQVHQRLVAACHLQPLQEADTKAYIKHRLKQVGWRGDPAISEAVYPVIFKFSEGVPRRINLICSRLLLHGCVEESHKLGIQDAKIVMSEIQEENLTSTSLPSEIDFSVPDFFDSSEFRSPGPVVHQQTSKLKARETGNQVNSQVKISLQSDPTDQATTPTNSSPAARTESSSMLAEAPRKENIFLSGDEQVKTKEKPYMGPDSRKRIRRQNAERRKEIRFEPGKEDRRKKPGRRKGDHSGSNWKGSVT